jgi:hypothetical protein
LGQAVTPALHDVRIVVVWCDAQLKTQRGTRLAPSSVIASAKPEPQLAFDALTPCGLPVSDDFPPVPARSKPLQGAKRIAGDSLEAHGSHCPCFSCVLASISSSLAGRDSMLKPRLIASGAESERGCLP